MKPIPAEQAAHSEIMRYDKESLLSLCDEFGVECKISWNKTRLSEVLRGNVVSGSFGQQQIHGNNFCPCGSGKKYKKCCGK